MFSSLARDVAARRYIVCSSSAPTCLATQLPLCTRSLILPRSRISPATVATRFPAHPLASLNGFSSSLLRTRHISSSTTPNPNSTESQNPPLPTPKNSAPRKSKVDLRPGPVKPPSSTLRPARNHVLQPIKPSPITTTPESLKGAKEIAVKDVKDAELHGILKPPPTGANWFRRTLHKGIELAKFYYRGVKLIFTRRKEISLIRARVKAGGSPLTRQESRFIRVQKDDVNKVIPFLIIALLLEEVIPLIAIYAPFMLPSTCILPSQQARIEEKKTEKALKSSSVNQALFARLKKKEDPKGHLSLDALRVNGASSAMCGLLGLSTIGSDVLRIRRIRRHLEFITKDDELLIQDNLALSEKDLNDALEERGIMTLSLDHQTRMSHLQWWIDSVKGFETDNPVTRRLLLLVSRP
ncbi:hypothetical protein BDQ12DRAFT_673250 [Crucibulum laeve]|uniref:Letm1 RBD domain-containing protein n=1 Tax=Crucibulum laeve TaxID=68775 RepID=A0A5C3MT89_9AGAR|nr:hypothetical protein BDQ12DRAFT_673250 [Crucibulum laeve]